MTARRLKRWMLAAAMTLAGAGAVRAEVPLPADYTQLAYIDASGTQYLRTGVNVQSDTSFEISFGKFRPYWGSSVFEQGAWDNTCRLGADGDGRFVFGTTTAQLPEVDSAADYVVTVGDGKLTIAKDGGTPTEVALASITGSLGTELALFARNNGGDNRAACRFYGMKIWNGEKTLLRDFIPCRKPSGEAGLWDSVSGTFFGNAASGSRFYAEGDVLTCVKCIKQMNCGYIDTGYKPSQNTCLEMDLTVGGKYETWFGAAAKDGDWWTTRAFALANDNKNIYVGFGNGFGNCQPILSTGWQGTIKLSKDGFQIRQAGQAEWTTRLSVDQRDFEADSTLYLCANNTNPQYIYKTNQGMSFTGVRVYENGSLVHEYLPACDADGTLGVLDMQNGNEFIPTVATGCAQFFAINGNLAYLKQGMTLAAYEGTLVTADLTGFEAVEKAGFCTLNASAVTSYPALTLSKGVFSLKDNAATAYTVTGALALEGGARLAIDVTGDGCDQFSVGSLVLDAALTAANPFTIEVNTVGVSSLSKPMVLVTGGNLIAEDVAKFRVVGISEVVLQVTDGNLVMKSSEGGVARATWKGGADSALDDPGNWTCLDGDGNEIPGAVPTETTTVTLPDGCVFNCTNGAPFVCQQLILPATLGGNSDLRGVRATLAGTVDLKGYKLYLSEANGMATFTGGKYQILESLRAPKGAYIDTGYLPDQDSRTCMRLTVGGKAEAWFGCGGNGEDWWQDTAYALANDSSGVYVGYHGSSGTKRDLSILPVGWSGTIELNKNVVNFYKDDSAEPTVSYPVGAQTFTAVNTMWLFAQNEQYDAQWQTKADNNVTFRGCQIWSGNGTLVRDYVPARRLSDGVVGLIDRANGNEFKQSASATAFEAVGNPREVDDGGEVHFDIPADQTKTNAVLSFTGNVKVVKEGEGALVASKTGQSYAGGTDVVAGTFRCGADGQDNVYGMAGSAVTVREGATFDCDGWANHTQFRFVLDGGTLKNLANRGRQGNSWISDVTLTKDSFMTGYLYGFVGSSWAESFLRMNNHVLTVEVQSPGHIYAGNLSVEGGGEIFLKSGGYFDLGGNQNGGAGKYVRGETTTLRVKGCVLHDLGGEHVFGSYISEISANTQDDPNTVIKVLGRFVPGVKWHATELQDGATLDLSANEGTWDMTNVIAVPGATINVDLGTRTIGVGEKVIGWTPETAPAKGVKFLSKLGKLRKMSDGAYYMQPFMIMIR